MAKSIETLKPHISGLHRSNVKCFTIFPHKIQLPIDLNRFRIQKSVFDENPDFPEFKKPDFSRGRQRLIFSNTVSEWPWSGNSKTVKHVLITRTLVARGLGPVWLQKKVTSCLTCQLARPSVAVATLQTGFYFTTMYYWQRRCLQPVHNAPPTSSYFIIVVQTWRSWRH